MSTRIFAAATLFTTLAGVLAARAADSQLLGMVMPDAKVVVGINVDQAKTTPFGQYVLSQLQSSGTGMKDLIALTGFDPTRDVHELLAASSGAIPSQAPAGLVLARGNFAPAAITTLATGNGVLTEFYHGVTLLEDPKKTAAIAFINSTVVVAGDVANVKAAIDRPGTGQTLPSAVVTLVNQWSGSQDAWFVTTVPPASLAAPLTGAGATGVAASVQGVLQQVQQAEVGVKFGSSVVGTTVFQADTTQNATQMGAALQFLLNMAQMQGGQNNQQLAGLAQATTITTSGNTVKVVLNLPQALFQQLVQSQRRLLTPTPRAAARK